MIVQAILLLAVPEWRYAATDRLYSLISLQTAGRSRDNATLSPDKWHLSGTARTGSHDHDRDTEDGRDWTEILRGVKHLGPDDVVLILKTGVMVADRMVQQLESFMHNTSYWRPENVFCTADATYAVRDFECIDVIEELTQFSEFNNTVSFKAYWEQRAIVSQPGYDILRGSSHNQRPLGEMNHGWTLDAYKYIPGFRQALHRFPKAKWFYTIDDDTFVQTRSLLQHLDMLDPTAEVYTGHYMWDFIHGGSGIVMSRAAVAKRFEAFGDDERLNAWSRKLAERVMGDVSLKDAMADPEVGIQPNKDLTPAFSRHPPALTVLTPGNACQAMVAFNHVLAAEQVEFYHNTMPLGTDGGAVTWVEMWLRLEAARLRKAADGESYDLAPHFARKTDRRQATDLRKARLDADRFTLNTHAALSEALYFNQNGKVTHDDRDPLDSISYAETPSSAEECRLSCLGDAAGRCLAWQWLSDANEYNKFVDADAEDPVEDPAGDCLHSDAVYLPTSDDLSPKHDRHGGWNHAVGGLNLDELYSLVHQCEGDRWRTLLTRDAKDQWILRPEYRAASNSKAGLPGEFEPSQG